MDPGTTDKGIRTTGPQTQCRIDRVAAKNSAAPRHRSVLTRAEAIKDDDGRRAWPEGRSPFGLAEGSRVMKVAKKAKKEKVEEAAPTEGGAEAAPAARRMKSRPGEKQ